MTPKTIDQEKYVGMWVTADGYIRHELLPGALHDSSPEKSPSKVKTSYASVRKREEGTCEGIAWQEHLTPVHFKW